VNFRVDFYFLATKIIIERNASFSQGGEYLEEKLKGK